MRDQPKSARFGKRPLQRLAGFLCYFVAAVELEEFSL
jgi:hypothetical protein